MPSTQMENSKQVINVPVIIIISFDQRPLGEVTGFQVMEEEMLIVQETQTKQILRSRCRKQWCSVSLGQSPQQHVTLLLRRWHGHLPQYHPSPELQPSAVTETSQLHERLFYFRAYALIPRVGAERKPWLRLQLHTEKGDLLILETNPTFV